MILTLAVRDTPPYNVDAGLSNIYLFDFLKNDAVNLNIYFISTIKGVREGIFKENYRFYLTENHSELCKI